AVSAYDVHRNMLGIESDRILLIAIMQLAYAFDANALLLQDMPPPLRVANVGHRVIPMTGLMDPIPGGERRPRRDTDGARRIGICKTHASRRQRVQVRSLDKWMP